MLINDYCVAVYLNFPYLAMCLTVYVLSTLLIRYVNTYSLTEYDRQAERHNEREREM